MTIDPSVSITGNNLVTYGRKILTDVPVNVQVKPDFGVHGISGGFIGASSLSPSSRHVFSLGRFRESRFLSCFRFKLWWMTQRVGTRGSQIPVETQFLLIESRNKRTDVSLTPSAACGGDTDVTYVVMLPLLDGSFRSSFSGDEDNNLLLCVESGDPTVVESSFHHAVYIHSGPNPYQVTTEAVRAVEDHSKTFMTRDQKQMPGMLDCFGWCTWDAFYTDVSVEGVHEGLSSLAAGGVPAKFLIIDDGWQSVGTDGCTTEDIQLAAGTQFASRLMHLKENGKFQKKKGHSPGDAAVALGHVVREIKSQHRLSYVYVWHALMGYWGGLSVNPTNKSAFGPSLVYPVPSSGVLTNQPNMAQDSLTVNGLGVVPPDRIAEFYNSLHGYLSEQGVDGVKVDVQAILETLGSGYGGRVKLAQVYHQALEDSVARHFPDNGIISCMSHHTDGIYSSRRTAVVRASDDFYPRDTASHTTHIASVAYNSLFLGEFMQPDWDMFHSVHPAAAYHAAARAVGGCAVYVSDKPGTHDFDLLKKLVLPDGSVLRALLPGRPCRDSLFIDPARDNHSILKIWNMNRYGGVVGAFNCQGAGWCTNDRKYAVHDESPMHVTGLIQAMDVDGLCNDLQKDWNGDAVLYSHLAGNVVRLSKGVSVPITLGALEFEVYTVVPIIVLSDSVEVAPIGLTNMFNSGGAILSVSVEAAEQRLTTLVKGCGRFSVYSSRCPSMCAVDGVETALKYDPSHCKVTVELGFREGHAWSVTLGF